MSFLKNVMKELSMLHRQAFLPHRLGSMVFHDLDELIVQKDNFVQFIMYEYSLAVIYNIVLGGASLYYLFNYFSVVFECHSVCTLWLCLVTAIKIVEIVPKLVIIRHTYKVNSLNSDINACLRRLVYMTQSKVYFYNSVLSLSLLFLYTVLFFTVDKDKRCVKANNFFEIINTLVTMFFVRLITAFVNYVLHFKYEVNQADTQNTNFYADLQTAVSKETIGLIPCHTLTEKNIKEVIPRFEDKQDLCVICFYEFSCGQNVRVLPCNKKHVFHTECIDKWLMGKKNCPTCRVEITKKLIRRKKIY